MSTDISKRIQKLYGEFSKGQRKIADAILHEYDKVAYMTASRLGGLVGVSESTVVRFSCALGYEGYSEFQQAVQELVRAKLTPNQRIMVTTQRIGNDDVLIGVMESDIARIRHTLATIDRETFDKAVSAILSARRIYCMGARSSEAPALFMAYNLSLVFDNVKRVNPSSSAEVFEQLFSIGKGDVMIAFSFPRYSTKMIKAVRYARQNGAEVIVITDSSISPLAEHASYLITAESDMASFTDSLVAPMSIINAFFVQITNRCQFRIADRFDKLEKIWNEYDVYAK